MATSGSSIKKAQGDRPKQAATRHSLSGWEKRAVFERTERQKERWFILQLVMGYIALALLPIVVFFAGFVICNHATFPDFVVAAASVALFTNVVGSFVVLWKFILRRR